MPVGLCAHPARVTKTSLYGTVDVTYTNFAHKGCLLSMIDDPCLHVIALVSLSISVSNHATLRDCTLESV